MKLKRFIKTFAKDYVYIQRLYRWYLKRSKFNRYPDWHALLNGETDRWQASVAAASGGPKILLGTSIGAHMNANIVDSLLATALTVRGAEVHVLLCDSALPACFRCEVGLITPRQFIKQGIKSQFCKNCHGSAYAMYKSLGVKVHNYSELVTSDDRSRIETAVAGVQTEADIDNYVIDDAKIGEHAMAGVLRYFASATTEGRPAALEIAKLYFRASLITYYATRNLTERHKFEAICCLHGIYVPHGIINEVARAKHIRVVNWTASYRKRSFLFSHHDTYHHTLMKEPVDTWLNMRWNDELRTETTNYLMSRQRGGGRDWITFLSDPSEDSELIKKELPGIDLGKKSIGLLTNVAWDAQLHYPTNAFKNMLEWIMKTIAYFEKRKDLQLIIRVHPAEVSGDIPSRQQVVDEIAKRFPVLPDNVFVIRPESRISTYAVMQQCNAVIIYGTKAGVELTSRGIPVVVAGEAWIKNKGITIDAASEAEYYRILDSFPLSEGLGAEQKERALRYAFHFFFRRMIPVNAMQPTGGEPQYRIEISGLDDLLPGRDKGLDVICDGILKGDAFIYHAENESKARK